MEKWTKIILVRHGQTAFNAQKRVMGWLDEELNQTGQKQAVLLGKRLRNWKIDLFFTSPLLRARQTCDAIAQHHKAQAQTIEDFGELHITIWEGLSLQQIEESYPKEWEIWRKKPVLLNIHGLEPLTDARKRVSGALNPIIKENRGKTLLIATHDGIARLAMFHLLGLDNTYYRSFPIKNASISIVGLTNSKAELLLFNDVSHIEG